MTQLAPPVHDSGYRTGVFTGRAMSYWMTAYRRTWRGSAITSFLTPLLYLGAMGFGLGTLVNRSSGGIDGVPYVLFVAPGVLTATAMQVGAGEATYPVTGAIKWQRQYHAMLAAPLEVADVLLGHLTYIVMRVALAVAAFVVVGLALDVFRTGWIVAGAAMAVLCGAAHAAPVMAFAARLENESGFALFFRLVLIPMFLFAGTFFPVSQLPGWVQPVAWVTPLWHATTATRDLALGTAEWLPVLGHAGYLVLWIVVGTWLALRAFRARLID